jgi:hypothetical protein
VIAGIGLDPGPSTGISVLRWDERNFDVHVFQCDAGSATMLARWVMYAFSPLFLASEAFVTSNGAGSRGKNADITKQVLHDVEMIAREQKIHVHRNPAANVKPWATDKRLEKIGFPLGPKFRDARDSARHCLYAGVKTHAWPDPLIRR